MIDGGIAIIACVVFFLSGFSIGLDARRADKSDTLEQRVAALEKKLDGDK